MVDFINQAYEWIQVATMVVALASVIASMTDTPKDDEWVAKIYKIVDILAINIGKAKQK